MSTLPPPGQGHDEAFEELVAGFALGALGPADARQLREHLADCERCRALLGEYGAVAATLPDALEPIEPSPGLRQSILDRAAGELSVAAPLDGPVARASEQRPAPLRPRRAPLWALPLAALLLVALGLGYWNAQLQQQVQQQAIALQAQREALVAVAAGGRQWSLAGTDAAPGSGGVLIQDPNDPRPILLCQGLPDLPPDRAYQAWVLVGGTPAEAGMLAPGQGGARVVRLDRPLGQADTVAVTVEPAGGSRVPTGPIVIAGRL